VSLVVKKSQLHKALNVIHGDFGVAKKINVLFWSRFGGLKRRTAA
jgi:aspartokinase/homoserine dehydrogenase 1